MYRLPDDSEVITVPDGHDGYLLYTPVDWKLYPHAPAAYEVYASGAIHRKGQPTPWRVEDLIDTGRTAEWDAPANRENKSSARIGKGKAVQRRKWS